MPMVGSFKKKQVSSDLEFAGQSSAKKRQSIKQMSSIVEVDESADIENSKRQKQKHGDIVYPDGTQLQSVASMNQVTDTEAEQSKR